MADRVQRFSYDLFSYVFAHLKVPANKINFAGSKPHSDDYTEDIGYCVVITALCFRSDLKYAFDKEPNLVIGTPGFENFIERFLHAFVPKKNILDITLGSCIIFAEFAVRKYNENRNFDLAPVPACWASFFSDRFLAEFMKKGGWDELKKKAKVSKIVSTNAENILSQLELIYDPISFIDKFKDHLPQRKDRMNKFDKLEPGKDPSQQIQHVTSVCEPGPSSADSSTFSVSDEAGAKAGVTSKKGKASLKRSACPPSEVPEKTAKESPKKGVNP